MSQTTSVKISPVNMEERQKLDLKSGNTVRVWQKIKEGDKTRLQMFEGILLARKHGNESGATFTVRKVIDSVGVEKTFPLYSPVIDKIEVVSKANTRRSKLYFVRRKAVKETRKRLKMERVAKKQEQVVEVATEEKESKEEVKV